MVAHKHKIWSIECQQCLRHLRLRRKWDIFFNTQRSNPDKSNHHLFSHFSFSSTFFLPVIFFYPKKYTVKSINDRTLTLHVTVPVYNNCSMFEIKTLAIAMKASQNSKVGIATCIFFVDIVYSLSTLVSVGKQDKPNGFNIHRA